MASSTIDSYAPQHCAEELGSGVRSMYSNEARTTGGEVPAPWVCPRCGHQDAIAVQLAFWLQHLQCPQCGYVWFVSNQQPRRGM
jgi:rubredoxin